ncbi:MAG TPA: phosphatase PAP2 family protein [Thermoanaerobaculia bacterium]|nr:phosphatase PAP2 family protein [Thermoanaerobaculia bacterium]
MPRLTAALLAASLLAASAVVGQETQDTPPAPTQPGPGPLALIGREAKIYYDDSKALFFAPFHWDGKQVWTALGAGALVSGVMIFDEPLARSVQDHATAATNQMSKIVTPFGSWAAWATSGALVVSGIAFREGQLTAMGREGIEACLIAGLMTDILKPVFGRQRPVESANETAFRPFSSHDSFPSGHATVAFAFASVVSARSSGWVIPAASYTLASLVAYSRVNDHKHFPSDVVAGGLIGTAVGRFIVHRHQRVESGAPAPKAEIFLFPIRNGLGIAARF